MGRPGDEIVFTCIGGHQFTAWECEMGMTQGTMDYLMELQELEHNFEADTAHEEELARCHVLGDLECPWPWYADAPSITQDPEVIVL